METIAYVTERLQLVMDMGDAIVEVGRTASKLMRCLTVTFPKSNSFAKAGFGIAKIMFEVRPFGYDVYNI